MSNHDQIKQIDAEIEGLQKQINALKEKRAELREQDDAAEKKARDIEAAIREKYRGRVFCAGEFDMKTAHYLFDDQIDVEEHFARVAAEFTEEEDPQIFIFDDGTAPEVHEHVALWKGPMCEIRGIENAIIAPEMAIESTVLEANKCGYEPVSADNCERFNEIIAVADDAETWRKWGEFVDRYPHIALSMIPEMDGAYRTYPDSAIREMIDTFEEEEAEKQHWRRMLKIPQAPMHELVNAMNSARAETDEQIRKLRKFFTVPNGVIRATADQIDMMNEQQIRDAEAQHIYDRGFAYVARGKTMRDMYKDEDTTYCKCANFMYDVLAQKDGALFQRIAAAIASAGKDRAQIYDLPISATLLRKFVAQLSGNIHVLTSRDEAEELAARKVIHYADGENSLRFNRDAYIVARDAPARGLSKMPEIGGNYIYCIAQLRKVAEQPAECTAREVIADCADLQERYGSYARNGENWRELFLRKMGERCQAEELRCARLGTKQLYAHCAGCMQYCGKKRPPFGGGACQKYAFAE